MFDLSEELPDLYLQLSTSSMVLDSVVQELFTPNQIRLAQVYLKIETGASLIEGMKR